MRSLDGAMQDFQPSRDSLSEIIDVHVGQIRERMEENIYDRGRTQFNSKVNTILTRSGRYGVFNTHRLTYA